MYDWTERQLNRITARPLQLSNIFKLNPRNVSTQFADGGEFGFGAEIGISTDKLHVRGPVGAKHLTTFKYIVHGNGQARP